MYVSIDTDPESPCILNGEVWDHYCSATFLLRPNPTRRLTADSEQALSHTWFTSFAAPTEHDLCDLRKNFDPRAYWHNAIAVPVSRWQWAIMQDAVIVAQW